MAEQIFHGVPRALVLDGWWLSADAEYDAPQNLGRSKTQNLGGVFAQKRILLLLALLALADILFFEQALGLSIALFGVAVFLANLLEQDPKKPMVAPAVLLIAANLPVIEYVQTASVLFAICGLIIAVTWSRLGAQDSFPMVFKGTRRLLALAPVSAFRSANIWLRTAPEPSDFNGIFRGFVKNWAIPLGGALLILSLLVSANPVLERWVDTLLDVDVDFDLTRLTKRILFWGGMALIIWPLLSLSTADLRRPDHKNHLQQTQSYGLNPRSVTHALVLFNGLLALQLMLDGQVFWGSGDLPAGVSYAEYAHRGAYPLLVTALLAGGFALAARPFLNHGRWLKHLMLVWLGLNVLLTLSAFYRLEIYVEAYGLTYLRVRAGIWMGLVALWLGLIAWQIGRGKGNGWLLLRSFALGAGTLYLGCFINFAHVIAAYNLNHHRVDGLYLCQMDVTASRALWGKVGQTSCALSKPRIEGWRDWGFREWRVARYIESLEAHSAIRGEDYENSRGR